MLISIERLLAEGDALRTVARFTTFMAMTEGTQRRRPIGFLR